METSTILQIVGIALIGLAFIFTYCQWSWIALGTFIAVGIVDIVLAVQKQKTISQGIHKWFPQWGDTIVMVALLAFTWIVWGVTGFLPVIMGVIIGHLFWHED